MQDQRLFYPATLRNREPILQVLQQHLPSQGTLLEVAAGSGEHAVFFAPHFPNLQWLPSEGDPALLPSIDAWRRHLGVDNVAVPLLLSTLQSSWPVAHIDALICINMVHIAPWEATLGLLRGGSRYLPPGGLLFLYGPFRLKGQFTAASNATFDAALRQQDSRWGVRDVDAVAAAADEAGLHLQHTIPMPSNNFSLLFYRR